MLMPTYVCYLPRDRFDREQKARIAGAISQRHSEATGAPSYFVQVMIEETDAGDNRSLSECGRCVRAYATASAKSRFAIPEQVPVSLASPGGSVAARDPVQSRRRVSTTALTCR